MELEFGRELILELLKFTSVKIPNTRVIIGCQTRIWPYLSMAYLVILVKGKMPTFAKYLKYPKWKMWVMGLPKILINVCIWFNKIKISFRHYAYQNWINIDISFLTKIRNLLEVKIDLTVNKKYSLSLLIIWQINFDIC